MRRGARGGALFAIFLHRCRPSQAYVPRMRKPHSGGFLKMQWNMSLKSLFTFIAHRTCRFLTSVSRSTFVIWSSIDVASKLARSQEVVSNIGLLGCLQYMSKHSTVAIVAIDNFFQLKSRLQTEDTISLSWIDQVQFFIWSSAVVSEAQFMHGDICVRDDSSSSPI